MEQQHDLRQQILILQNEITHKSIDGDMNLKNKQNLSSDKDNGVTKNAEYLQKQKKMKEKDKNKYQDEESFNQNRYSESVNQCTVPESYVTNVEFVKDDKENLKDDTKKILKPNRWKLSKIAIRNNR